MVNLSTVKSYAYKKVWGEHSLTVGEIVCVLLAGVIWHFKLLGKWSTWAAIAIALIGMTLF